MLVLQKLILNTFLSLLLCYGRVLALDIGIIVSAAQAAAAQHTTSAVPPSVTDCNPDDWNPTVENWVAENVDEKFSSWALNMNPNPPTSLVAGSFPTELPRIFTGFGARSDVKGLAGQLMSIAGGGTSANCELLLGENEQCGKPPTVTQACGNMPRWAYFAWQAIYNMFSIHYAINSVLTMELAAQLGQAAEVVTTFTPSTAASLAALEIFLSVLGSVVTIMGVLLPIGPLGAAAEGEVIYGKTGSTLGGLLGRGSGNPRDPGDGSIPFVPRSPGQPSLPAPSTDDPDAITPVNNPDPVPPPPRS